MRHVPKKGVAIVCAKSTQNLVGQVGTGPRKSDPPFADYFVVFTSPSDKGCFEAHSARTNQIGIGETIEEALYELFASLVDLLHEWRDPANDGNVCLWQEAPPEIISKMKSPEAIPVPEEIVDRAIQKIRGYGSPQWTPDTSDTADLRDDWTDDNPLHSSPAIGFTTENALELAPR